MHQQTNRGLCAFLRVGGALFPDPLQKKKKNMIHYFPKAPGDPSRVLAKLAVHTYLFPPTLFKKQKQKQLNSATSWRGGMLQQSEQGQKVVCILRWWGKPCPAYFPVVPEPIEVNWSQSSPEPAGLPGAPEISHSRTQTLRKQPYKECAGGRNSKYKLPWGRNELGLYSGWK